MMRDRKGDEAVSVLIGYVINLGVAAAVVGLLLFSLQGVFTELRGDATEAELEAIGENFAGEIERADVLIQTGTGGVNTTTRLPTANEPYTVNVTSNPSGNGRILLTSGGLSVEVAFYNETAIRGAGDGITLPEGSNPTIRYNQTGDVIEIE